MNAQNRDLKKAVSLAEFAAHEKLEHSPYRAAFHLMPPVGWMNDPNGLCEFLGEYHIFYQYAPFCATGGMVFWGHYKTRDFIHYDSLPPAICPDQSEDIHGAYSGSALIEDGTMYLYYTGNVKKLGNYDYVYTGREHNTLLVTSTDGIHFSEKTLLLTNRDDTADISGHLRDPKVWKEKGQYYMVQGARTIQDEGTILLYHSSDKLHWKEINRLHSGQPFGYMWECPDYFCLEGKQILSFSPQGLKQEELRFQNIYHSGYCFVEGNITKTCTLSDFREFDYGFDFYAPQTFEDSKGRRILIGWMGMPNDNTHYSNPTITEGWQHMLTVPRELSVRNGRLYQTPIEELQALRGKPQEFQADEYLNYSGAKVFELEIKVEEDTSFSALIRGAARLEYHDQCFTLRFLKGGAGRTCRRTKLEQLKNIRILCDTSSLEIFLNDGEKVLSSRYYPEEAQTGFLIRAQKAAVRYWPLSSFEYNKIG